MIFNDIIKSSEYVYSTFTKWGLKKFICHVEYFTEESLNDLFDNTCFNCVSDKLIETDFNVFNAFVYSVVPLVMEDILLTVFRAVPKFDA